MKPELDSPVPNYRDMSGLFRDDKARGESQICYFRLLLVLLLAVFDLTYIVLLQQGHLTVSEIADFICVAISIVHSGVMLMALKRLNYRRYWGFLSMSVDNLLILVCVYAIRYGYKVSSPVFIVYSALFMLYALTIFISMLRHDPVNCLYTGALSGVLYFCIVLVLHAEGAFGLRFVAQNGEVFQTSMALEIFKVLLLFLSGFLAYLASKNNFALLWRSMLAEKRIRSSLREKEVLLQEIHHRVKNNMQIISSLLKMEKRKLHGEGLRQAFEESQGRIRAMSIVHETLYNSRDLSEIRLEDYLNKLSRDIRRTFKGSKEVDIRLDIEDTTLNLEKTVPFGLIINELLTNSFRHAFAARKQGRIEISLRRMGDNEIELTVHDNGRGIPADVDTKDPRTLGLQLITGLAEKQLAGTCEIKSNGGTTIEIRFRTD